ncbi:hypothetical protein E3C22_00840 [Jiella endophytica]|uniref:Uncharacterized protein n=1 Tax=Jiella endophytica TaxID=2558362 RepID=A0A4Y8RH21_9HYPH|nr:hypothetical protein [Jiella endophytica]TFF20760.1 hypothetical protein E3C22_17880 [Jiella endophytica]TFF27061.1 hypothetical protein E3C22_00840 [Jiella endophytica]
MAVTVRAADKAGPGFSGPAFHFEWETMLDVVPIFCRHVKRKDLEATPRIRDTLCVVIDEVASGAWHSVVADFRAFKATL